MKVASIGVSLCEAITYVSIGVWWLLVGINIEKNPTTFHNCNVLSNSFLKIDNIHMDSEVAIILYDLKSEISLIFNRNI